MAAFLTEDYFFIAKVVKKGNAAWKSILKIVLIA